MTNSCPESNPVGTDAINPPPILTKAAIATKMGIIITAARTFGIIR